MLNITKIVSLAPVSKESEDSLITMAFSNGETTTMVLLAPARYELERAIEDRQTPPEEEEEPHAGP